MLCLSQIETWSELPCAAIFSSSVPWHSGPCQPLPVSGSGLRATSCSFLVFMAPIAPVSQSRIKKQNKTKKREVATAETKVTAELEM